jgi:tellurite resistance-related uncharacterized protein
MKPISIIIYVVFVVLSTSSFSTTTTTMSFVVKSVASRMRRNTIHPLLIQKNGNTANDDGLMPILPNDVVKYSQVPKEGSFTNTTIPKGLLNRHTTKAGTWGVISILKGSLEYKIAPKGNKMKKDENYEGEDDHIMYPTQFILTPTTQNGIIEPERYHKVQAVAGSDDNENDEEELEFVVEFHRVPGTGPVDEKRE